MNFDALLTVLSAVKNSTIATAVNSAGNPVDLLKFLQANGYAIMLVLMIIEGPIVTYVAAFAASLGVFNVYYVFILSFLGNILGDLVIFSIGRFGRKFVIEKYVSHWLKAKRIRKIRNYLKNNPGKTIAIIKLTPPLPIPGIMITGASDISLKTYFSYSSRIDLLYCLSITLLGFYSGVAFNAFAVYIKRVEYIIGALVLLAIGIYFLMKYIQKYISTKVEKI